MGNVFKADQVGGNNTDNNVIYMKFSSNLDTILFAHRFHISNIDLVLLFPYLSLVKYWILCNYYIVFRKSMFHVQIFFLIYYANHSMLSTLIWRTLQLRALTTELAKIKIPFMMEYLNVSYATFCTYKID